MEGDVSDSGRTALHRNAFHILGASLDDSRREIVRLAEQKALLLPEIDVRRARAELTQPRTRLVAEIGWLLGVAPNSIKQLLDYGRLDSDILPYVRVPALSQANAYAAIFEDRLAKQQHADWTTYDLPAYLSIVDRVDAADVTEILNAHREASGFPKVDIAQVREALNEQRRYYLSVCNRALDRLGLASRRVVLGKALDECDAEAHFVHELIDAYELDQSSVIDEFFKGLDELADRIARDPAPNGAPLFQLKNRLPQYAKIVQPILLSRAMRGLDHRPTENLVWKLHTTAVDIANNRDAFETSYAVVTLISDAFSGVPSVQGIVASDIEQLEAILERVRQDRAACIPATTQHLTQPVLRKPTQTAVHTPPRAWNQKKSGAWTAIAAVAALLLIANVFSSDANNNGTAQRSGSEGVALATESSDRDRCDGVDEWWDGTDRLMRRWNDLYGQTYYSLSHSERIAIQGTIQRLADVQRSSVPPPEAEALNSAYIEVLDFSSEAITDYLTTDAEVKRMVDSLLIGIELEKDSLSVKCGI